MPDQINYRIPRQRISRLLQFVVFVGHGCSAALSSLRLGRPASLSDCVRLLSRAAGCVAECNFLQRADRDVRVDLRGFPFCLVCRICG